MNITVRLDKLCEGNWRRLLDRFRVSGRPQTNSPVVFIAESPHTDEVRSGGTPECRYPLAGRSGKTVTNALRCILPCEHHAQPIGWLAAHGKVKWLSTINISEVPLDIGAYVRLVAKREVALNRIEDVSLEHWMKLMYSLQLVKDGPVKNRRREHFVNRIEDEIKEDFSCRAKQAIGCNTKLVVFLGNTAKSYYELMCSGLSVDTMCVPHPSPSSSNSNVWECSQDLCTRIQSVIQDWNEPESHRSG